MYLYDDQLMTIPDNIYDTFFFVEYKLKVVVPPPHIEDYCLERSNHYIKRCLQGHIILV